MNTSLFKQEFSAKQREEFELLMGGIPYSCSFYKLVEKSKNPEELLKSLRMVSEVLK